MDGKGFYVVYARVNNSTENEHTESTANSLQTLDSFAAKLGIEAQKNQYIGGRTPGVSVCVYACARED